MTREEALEKVREIFRPHLGVFGMSAMLAEIERTWDLPADEWRAHWEAQVEIWKTLNEVAARALDEAEREEPRFGGGS